MEDFNKEVLQLCHNISSIDKDQITEMSRSSIEIFEMVIAISTTIENTLLRTNSTIFGPIVTISLFHQMSDYLKDLRGVLINEYAKGYSDDVLEILEESYSWAMNLYYILLMLEMKSTRNNDLKISESQYARYKNFEEPYEELDLDLRNK